MAATLNQIIKASLRKIGVLASGEEPTPEVLEDVQLQLQQLLDSWSTDGLLVPVLTHESFTIPADAGTLTMGTGGDLNTSVPLSLLSASILAGTLEQPVRVATMDLYASIAIKSSVSTYPDYVYFEPGAALATLRFSAVPEPGNSLKLITQKTLGDIPALTSSFTLPKGYERLIVMGLAIEIAPDFGRTIDTVTGSLFSQAYKSMKRFNSQDRGRSMRVDTGLLNKGAGTYDVDSGP